MGPLKGEHGGEAQKSTTNKRKGKIGSLRQGRNKGLRRRGGKEGGHHDKKRKEEKDSILFGLKKRREARAAQRLPSCCRGMRKRARPSP